MSGFPIVGVARLATAVVVGAGLVLVSQHTDARLELRAGPAMTQTDGPARRNAVRQRVLPCAGQELSGIAGVADTPVAGRIALAAPPPALLRAVGAPTDPPPPDGSVLSIRAAGEAGTGAARSTSALTPAVARIPRGAASVVARGDGTLAPGSTAGQEWSSDSPQVRGLAGTACVTPATQAWLIAGGGAAGRQERLVLANPGANEVTVNVSVLGAKGPVANGHERTVVVPGNGRAAVLVDAVAGTEPTPAVHVVATGGTVAATLTDTWLDGVVPAGAETAAPAAPPATVQIVPVARLDEPGALRIVVPGDVQAVVSARLLTAKGPVPLAKGGVHNVQARSVLELPLPQTRGIQAVEVRADVPVLAAAESRVRDGGAAGDFAWSAGSPAVSGLAGAAFPAGSAAPRRTVSLVATGGEATVEMTVVAAGKARTSRTLVRAGAVVLRDIGSPDAVWLRKASGPGELRAGVLSTLGSGPGMRLSALALRDLPISTPATRALPLP